MPKFYITGLYHTEEFNDRTLPPIEVEAESRVEALCRIRGVTVWTEEEFNESRKDPRARELFPLDPIHS